ncbi:DUF5810 domain-containing protein [Halobaculum sp. MBLA0147]|uniref:DUF5810 domain-containing protein n=1 Tax=Halobaculum sp. MBLA0147 TaxID=3079934 RepID=UPI003526696E
MGYACPVCEAPQRDGEHLANHLAFTALLRGGDHEAWLDEHVPSWEDGDPDELAETVTDHAAAAEYDEVFEDTTEDHAEHVGGHDHQHQHGHGPAQGHGGGAGAGAGGAGGARPTPSGRGYDGSADQAAVDGVVAEARRLTAEMYGVDPDEVAEPATDEENPSDESGGDDADSGDADTDDADDADEA